MFVQVFVYVNTELKVKDHCNIHVDVAKIVFPRIFKCKKPYARLRIRHAATQMHPHVRYTSFLSLHFDVRMRLSTYGIVALCGRCERILCFGHITDFLWR